MKSDFYSKPSVFTFKTEQQTLLPRHLRTLVYINEKPGKHSTIKLIGDTILLKKDSFYEPIPFVGFHSILNADTQTRFEQGSKLFITYGKQHSGKKSCLIG